MELTLLALLQDHGFEGIILGVLLVMWGKQRNIQDKQEKFEEDCKGCKTIFLTEKVYDAKHEALVDKVDDLKDSVTGMDAKLDRMLIKNGG